MGRIVLEVDDKIAKAWRAYPPELKARFQRKLEASIAENIRKADKEEFFRHLDTVQQTAAANGLTQEILDQLLSEED
jgi:predicted house-cleaning noncanonical NTP pyrophosphatase (MazG superfamily)